jgi:hypothetical protein
MTPKDLLPADETLIRDIRRMIDETRSSVAVAVNVCVTSLYWQVGKRIHQEILKGARAEYGEAIVSTLSRQLQSEYGQGFSAKNLRHMIRFAEVFPDEAIVSTLWRQLSWSHFKEIIYQKEELQRDFYVQMCRIERWSVRALRQKIDSMLYERTAISRKPEELIRHELASLSKEDRLTPIWSLRIPIFLTSLAFGIGISKRTWKMPSCGSWSNSSWNWEQGFHSSPGRSGYRSITTTIISISFSLTASCGVLSPSTLNSVISSPPTKEKWSSIYAGWTSMNARVMKTHL